MIYISRDVVSVLNVSVSRWSRDVFWNVSVSSWSWRLNVSVSRVWKNRMSRSWGFNISVSSRSWRYNVRSWVLWLLSLANIHAMHEAWGYQEENNGSDPQETGCQVTGFTMRYCSLDSRDVFWNVSVLNVEHLVSSRSWEFEKMERRLGLEGWPSRSCDLQYHLVDIPTTPTACFSFWFWIGVPTSKIYKTGLA